MNQPQPVLRVPLGRDPGAARPGDLLFFYPPTIGHVGIALYGTPNASGGTPRTGQLAFRVSF